MQNLEATSKAIHYLDSIKAISAEGTFTSSVPQVDYPYDYVIFMDQMIHGRKMKRKDIIARSGLDPDYAYKLLNGRKKTRDRDYILALSIGAKLDIQQTQHALICSGMQPLNNTDIRSRIIIMGIQNKLSVYQINSHLEEQNLPEIHYAGARPKNDKSDPPSPKTPPKKHTYKIKNIVIEEGKKSPSDFVADDYTGTAVVTDEENNQYYLIFKYLFGDDGMKIYTMTEEQYKKHTPAKNEEITDNTDEETDSLESFSSLIDATSSEFFQCFLLIEDALRTKIDESMEKADDTKYYGNRSELSLVSDTSNPAIFIEYYNDAYPERKEYFQLLRYFDGNWVFTGSHESRFQELHLGEGYAKIYPGKSEHICFLQADQQTIKDIDSRYQYYFKIVRYHLDEFLIDEYKGFGIGKDTLYREVLEFATEQAKRLYYSGEYKDAWSSLLDAEHYINSLSDAKERLIRSPLNNHNMYETAKRLNKKSEAKKYKKLLLENKNTALAIVDTLSPEEQHTIFSPIYTILYNNYITLFDEGKENEAEAQLDEMLDLAENHYALSDKEDSLDRLHLYLHQADRIGNTGFQQAEEYYQRALKEIMTNHLDSNTDNCTMISVLYNNYAALLRDCIGYQEAMIYYGRALEILESARCTGHAFTEFELNLIDHIGEIMANFYEKNNCKLETERLLRKLDSLKNPSEKSSK